MSITQDHIDKAAAQVIAGTLGGFDYEVPDDADAVKDAEQIVASPRAAGYIIAVDGGK